MADSTAVASVTSTQSSMIRRSLELPGLDGVRALAVSLVVVHHAAALAGSGRSGVLAVPASAMDVGVSIFFVLSGFLIYRPFALSHNGSGRSIDVRSFWWRRAIRILPAYWLAFCFFWAIGVIRPVDLTDLLAYLTLLNVFRPASVFGGITQSWSLTVELCFYALVPLYSVGIRRMARRLTPWTAEIGGLGALVAMAHVFRVATHVGDLRWGEAELSGISYLWMPTHMDVIAAGMALAVLWVHRPSVPSAQRLADLLGSTAAWWFVALGVFVAYAYGVGGPSVTEGYSLAHLETRQVAYSVIGIGVVAPMVLGTEGTLRRVFEWRAVTAIGTVSYGLYLWHLGWMERVAGSLGAEAPSWARSWGSALGDINVAVLVVAGFGLGLSGAAVSWWFVERPMRRARRLVSSGRSWTAEIPQHWLARMGPATIVIAALAPLRGLMGYQGPPMEEGFMLAFPQELLAGRFPHRDFLHLYGPGSLWVLAGIYRVVGVSLGAERTVGFVQHLVVALALYHLVLPWGRRIATCSGLTALVILISPLGLSAMAWNGALAWMMMGFVAADHARKGSERATWWAVAAGACAAAALLYRPDLVIAVAAAAVAIAVSVAAPIRRRMLTGAGVVSSLWLVHFATSGPSAAFRGMVTDPVVGLRPGRRLPVPPSWGELDGFLQRAGGVRVVGWPLPMPPVAAQVALWFWIVPVAALFLVAVAWFRRSDPRVQRLTPVAIFGVLLFTQALQRPDTAHLSWVTGVTLPLCLPFAVAALDGARIGRRTGTRVLLATIPVVAVLVIAIPFYPLRTYADLVGQSVGFNRFGFAIERNDRRFYFGDEKAAESAQEVVDALDKASTPGQRLIVGPRDLSKTPYSDAFFYYLFPELVPGTRYIEMDPGIADAADSGLADELRESDWLIQSDAWSDWDEPNASTQAGSLEPNQVVAESYCMVLDSGTFSLSTRCR